MGRDKRKTRLDKGGATGGEFVGFGAFAVTPPNATSSLKPSPVYTGSDSQLSLAFKRITQKRDAVTKTRALNELQSYFEQTDCSRKDQAEALSHLVFVYHSKINYDDSPLVRAAAISCMCAAYARLPKAWNTLVTEKQPEVCGEMWCGRADPASEVRLAASAWGQEEGEEGPSAGVSSTGIIAYVTRILGYDRPRTMHDALFARKQQADATSPPDRDELDERFERIVGTALGGMDLWIRTHPETSDSLYSDVFHDGILWSTINSSKSSLRLKTYSLLSTLCQHGKSLVYGQVGLTTLPNLLTNALTQEKEASNVPSLLEVLLVFLNNFPNGDPWNAIDASLLVKGVGKQMKKACHGASASRWGPTILPLLASLPDDDDFALQLQLLRNMSTGVDAAIGPGDGLRIAAAVAECSSFFLLRRETEKRQMSSTAAKQFARFWCQVLRQHLSFESSSSMARGADDALMEALAESFCHFDEACFNRTHSAIYGIRDWFWDDQIESVVLDIKDTKGDRPWADLLNCVTQKRQSTDIIPSHADSLVRKRFQATLSRYQNVSVGLPDAAAYDLMIASVRCRGARDVFADKDADTNSGLERFLLNDLLRWIVNDTSSLSARREQRRFVALDFTLLRDCLISVKSPHKQKSIWETILAEIIASKCDLASLSEGLLMLGRDSNEIESSNVWTEILRCATLENFSVDVGEEAVSKYHSHYLSEPVDHVDDEKYKAEARKVSLFLRTCVGLNQRSSLVLVGQNVVKQWVQVVTPAESQHVFELGGDDDIQNPVLTTLLSLVGKGDTSMLSPHDAERVLLESWRRGGKLWRDESLPLLLAGERSSEHSLFGKLIKSGTMEIKTLLESFCQTSDSDFTHVALVCHVWSERAYRILRLCSEAAKSSNDASIPLPSLALVGLGDEELWKAAPLGKISVSHLYLCFVYLLQQFDAEPDRLALLEGSSDTSSTFASILLGLSDASNGIIVDPVTRRDHKCEFALSLFGGSSIPKELLLRWCRQVISGLAINMKMTSTSELEAGGTFVTRSVSVLSEILFALFDMLVLDDSRNASTADVVNASDVHEGDELWYVTEASNTREKAHVVKVHSDDFPRYYFTIRLDRSDGVQERQTVAERLRRLPQAPTTYGGAVLGSMSESEKEERVEVGDIVFEEVIKPVLAPLRQGEETPILEAAAECLNIIVSHCGLLGREGVGGTRYETFKLLSSLQSNIHECLISEDQANDSEYALQALRVLALSMGLGNVAPASKSNFKLMKVNPDEAVKAVVQVFENCQIGRESSQMNRATLEWLAVAVCEISDKALRMDAVGLVDKLAMTLLLQRERGNGVKMADSVLVMRAFQSTEVARSNDLEAGSFVEEEEKNIMTEVVRCFSADWQSQIDDICQYQVLDARLRTGIKLPVWNHPFRSLVETSLKYRAGLVAMAARSNCNKLVENLFHNDKRWMAFRLLDASADGHPIHDDYFVGDTTQQWLDKWQQDLIEEEAEELQDDVGLVGQWIPEKMMTELESWEERGEPDTSDEVIALGTMLCWLCFLSLVDSAATVEVKFRGSVSAYLDNVNVRGVLATALSHLNLFGKERNPKEISLISMQDALSDASFLVSSDIAALVMFRSAEVFPTHFKHWWEDDCPRGKREAVSKFVETKIAPDTLRKELARITTSSDLGDMTVSGSTVSREVTATYTQDECKLSIVIQVPATYPLRNVDVDGRLTLGIPEKRWKRWALQIRQMLNNQDGTLLDALMLWKENVDKDFAGLEPCPVCYCILSVKTHELPNLECSTCNNRFHSSCLYKWFHSSGKSQCVLCQQPWNGTRVQKGG